MYASNFFEEKIMSLLLNGTGITKPMNLYLALFASNPGETGTGGTEISYTGYARKTIFFTSPTSSASGMSMENTATISFAESPTSTQNVQYVAVFDDLGGGNMWLYGELSEQLVIQAGVSPVFQPGSLKWTFNGNLSSYYREAIMRVLAGESASERANVGAFAPYIALYNGNPLASGSAELEGNQYARIPVTFVQSASQPASGALKYENSAEISSNAAGQGGWGTLTHIAIMDAQTLGHVFAGMPIRNNASYSITYGSVVGFHAGDLSFSIN